MKKNLLLLLIVSGLVLSISSPTYATFWNSGNNDNKNKWDDHNDQPRFEFPTYDFPKYDFPKYDFPKKHKHPKRPDPKDNPVPEPATAGLALMSLGALAFATRRRK